MKINASKWDLWVDFSEESQWNWTEKVFERRFLLWHIECIDGEFKIKSPSQSPCLWLYNPPLQNYLDFLSLTFLITQLTLKIDFIILQFSYKRLKVFSAQQRVYIKLLEIRLDINLRCILNWCMFWLFFISEFIHLSIGWPSSF